MRVAAIQIFDLIPQLGEIRNKSASLLSQTAQTYNSLLFLDLVIFDICYKIYNLFKAPIFVVLTVLNFILINNVLYL